ncbi:MAG: M15 family metallopeptidase [Saprospiraceae bacterium]
MHINYLQNITPFIKPKYSLFLFIFFIPYACNNTGNAQVENHISATENIATEIEIPPIEEEPTHVDTLPGAQPIEFSLEYLMGQFDPAQHPDFVAVEKIYSDGDAYFLRKETYESFKKMWTAAKADGIELRIISATRNFDRQKSIWEAKWTGARKIENGANASVKYPDPKTRALKILEYSSMPGTSRHHWGTDMDINDLDNYTFEHGKGKEVYDWMVANAARFGFCQPYSPKGEQRPNGYNEEKWHWSYIPVARQLTDLAATRLKDEMINGFKGAQTAVEIGVVQKYVLGVNEECRVQSEK